MKRRNYSMCLRMGATNYSLEVVTKREVINYDLSLMTKKERQALQHSVTAAFAKHQRDVLRIIDHA